MKKFELDLSRYSSHSEKSKVRTIMSIIHDPIIRAIYCYRKAENSGRHARKLFLKCANRLMAKKGIEIAHMDNIEGGICFIHPYGITINSRASIGDNFTIFKGATIGSVRSGKRKGIPHIGDRVTVCAGAVVLGGCKIGNDVLIAANAFVNFDVPSNSVVVGNPGVIHPKDDPSHDYFT